MNRHLSEKHITSAICMMLTVFILLAAGISADAAGEEAPAPSQLYARCAVLMDAGTGRILFAKHGDEQAPMASTTKIMTCILALETGDPDDVVTFSKNAARQPEVKLGAKEGETFLLKDLLYSLMLESHNDSAVAVAEHIAGSTEAFADLMNEKAAGIGCTSTYFITPNGLDASDENGIHHTTASDLARILRYCIMESPEREAYLDITREPAWTFSDCGGTNSYSCTNHNAFLKMMDGALTGKTGFTADAGYCYAGALERDGKTFIVALLACGWPNNKGYKWSDARTLMEYGLASYKNCTLEPEDAGLCTYIENGYITGYPGSKSVKIPVRTEGEPANILLRHDEMPNRQITLERSLDAPVEKGETLGYIEYSIDGFPAARFRLTAGCSARKRTFKICLDWITERFLFQKY